MFRLSCDRCGKNYATFRNVYQCPSGMYNIIKMNGAINEDPFGDNPDREVINLCPSCEKGLTKFLMIEEGE